MFFLIVTMSCSDKRQDCSKRIDAYISPELLNSSQPTVHTQSGTLDLNKAHAWKLKSKSSTARACTLEPAYQQEKCFREKHSLLLHNIHHPLLLTRQTLAGAEGRHPQLKNLFSISKSPIIRSQGESATRMGPGKGGDPTLVGSLHFPGTFCSCCDHTGTSKGSDNPILCTRNLKSQA